MVMVQGFLAHSAHTRFGLRGVDISGWLNDLWQEGQVLGRVLVEIGLESRMLSLIMTCRSRY